MSKAPYTVSEVVGLLWLWSSELNGLANDMQNEHPTDKLMLLKMKRVSREITELIKETEGLKSVQASEVHIPNGA